MGLSSWYQLIHSGTIGSRKEVTLRANDVSIGQEKKHSKIVPGDKKAISHVRVPETRRQQKQIYTPKRQILNLFWL